MVGFNTFAFSMTSFDFSDGTWGGNLRTELGNASIDGDTVRKFGF